MGRMYGFMNLRRSFIPISALLSYRLAMSLSLIRVLLLSEMFFSYCFFYYFYLSLRVKRKVLITQFLRLDLGAKRTWREVIKERQTPRQQ